ncbi:MAG: 50S ribosomal protein L28 [Elusimicrobia bacterium]|nr:50S ribosomal protein L28 [Elusimicrobiota bacterium]
MAFRCRVCGKGPVAGKSYSHSHKASRRVFRPNLQRQRVFLFGRPQRALVCTSCIRSGRAPRPYRAGTPRP